MNIKQLTDSIYFLPVVIDHIQSPSELTTVILAENGITDENIEEYKKVSNLLMYHLHCIQSNWKPNYHLLRVGLQEYFCNYLSNVFKELNIVDKAWKVLDYGCGSGQLGMQFEQDNPESRVMYLDRTKEDNIDEERFILCDFERYPDWYRGCKNEFDCVLMSELLHCKNTEGQHYLVNSAHNILKPGGFLIIIENIDYCMAYRMNKFKKETVLNVVAAEQVDFLTSTFFVLQKETIILNHKIYIYEKI
jgi:SAM-dependent methyltransferase